MSSEDRVSGSQVFSHSATNAGIAENTACAMNESRNSSTVRHMSSDAVQHESRKVVCPLVIHLDKHSPIKAAGFHYLPHQMRFFDAEQLIVFEHTFPAYRETFPWKRIGLHHDHWTVAFTAHDEQGCVLNCFNRDHRLHKNIAPHYLFSSKRDYGTFQTALRGKQYRDEFEVSSFRPHKMEKTINQFIKTWYCEAGLVLTLPVTHDSGAIKHQEIKAGWFARPFKVSSDTKFKIEFVKQETLRRKASDASHDLDRPVSRSKRLSFAGLQGLTRRGTTGSSLEALPQLPIPPEVVERFDHCVVHFASNAIRNDFISTLEQAHHFGLPTPPEPDSTLTSTKPTPSPDPPDSLPAELPLDPGLRSMPQLDLPSPRGDFFRRGGPQPILEGALQITTSLGRFYSPLPDDSDSIRMIMIDPGAGLKISCSLRKYKLTDPNLPKFEALSYCWQKGGAMKDIDKGGLKGYPVSEHLWSALRRLRLRDRPRLVWVDAVCINQTDLEEKSRQIGMMQKIYAAALRTVIWIGEFNPSAPTCLRCYNNTGETAMTLCAKPRLAALEHGGLVQDLKQYFAYLQEQEDSTQAADVWWKRLWCVQEFSSTQEHPSVFAGPHSIQWDHFVEIWEQKNRSSSLSLFKNLLETGNDGSHSLFTLLSLTGEFHCTDPRDRIFALMGMARPSTWSMQPDYRRSVIRVYEDACEALLEENGTVDILLDERLSRIDGIMPTWMPDFTCLQSRDRVKGRDEYASGGEVPSIATLVEELPDEDDVEDLDAPKKLKVRAIPFDNITARTKKSDIPDHEHSNNSFLIYNSLERRGRVIDRILNVLEYDFNTHKIFARRKHLDPAPFLGRLMLEYLFEGRRSILEELDRRSRGAERDELGTYARQRDLDLEYLRFERGISGTLHDVSLDMQYVEHRWNTKIKNARERNMFMPERMRTAYQSGDETIVEDFHIARDLGNLFAYARKTKNRYYFSGNNFEAPMRKDALAVKTWEEVRRLPSQFDTPDEELKSMEFHEYNQKNRERDFFKTSAGFLGLGPSTLQEGDQIIVPIGSSRPWLIRKVAGIGEAEYVLIGDVVLPSIMSAGWSKVEERRARDYLIR